MNSYTNGEQFYKIFIEILDSLDFYEVLSLMKSNRFRKGIRNNIEHSYMPHRAVKECLPVIAAGITMNTVNTVLSKVFNKNE